jgi:hypothetical protein
VQTAGGVIQSLRYHGALVFTGEPAIKAEFVTIQETYIDDQTPFEFVICRFRKLLPWEFRKLLPCPEPRSRGAAA